MLNEKTKEVLELLKSESREAIEGKLEFVIIQQDFSLKILKSSERILNFQVADILDLS
jgi:hypothetical protein